jgi:Cu(I)/Ag(I) efflux system membrane protein CusA/SilA
MMETTIILKPQDQWRSKPRWYTGRLPEFMLPLVRPLWPDRLSWDELVDEMDRALRIPGVTNAWTMPIKARIDMLTTGVRTPVGIKIFGPDLATLERIGAQIESLLPQVEGTRNVFAERAAGGYFVDSEPRRGEMARLGLTVAEVQDVVMTAIGGENVTSVVDGRARYSVNVRYPRELREDLGTLGRVLVDTPGGAAVPLAQVADLSVSAGPAMLRDENGFLAS